MDINQQFRQIDFLRLFRLCKEKNLVNRKRKMPVEYNRDGDAKNSIKRLLVLLAQDIFPNRRINANYDYITIPVNVDERRSFDKLLFVYNINGNTKLRNMAAEAQTLYGTIIDQPIIRFSFPHTIFVYFRNRNQRESFYKASQELIAFKKLYDEILIKSEKLYTDAEEEKKRLAEETRIKREQEAKIKAQSQEEKKKILLQAKKEKENKVQEAQKKFNELLQQKGLI